MKVISKDISFKGRKVLLRTDFNVHIEGGFVKETYRIERAMQTLDFLVRAGAKVIIISHIDSKEGGSLEPVARYLTQRFPRLRFVPDIYAPEVSREVADLKEGGILLFENLRKWSGEEDNDEAFAKYLASFADVFVQEGFAVCHREHASIVSIPKFLPSCAGFLVAEEVSNLSKAFRPRKPFLFILAGAKFSTKIPLVNKFLPVADNLFIAGAIANDIYKAKGLFVGDSLVDDENLDVSSLLNNEKIIIPIDVVTSHKGIVYEKKPEEISVGEKIVDAGKKTMIEIKKIVDQASFIVWNGTLGKYELGFEKATLDLAKMISESNAITIVGGGDTLTAIDKLELFEKFSFISTGGGAMLEFLAKETLPGLVALSTKENTQKTLEGEEKTWIKKFFS
jgi:phosphoglycerate kinase